MLATPLIVLCALFGSLGLSPAVAQAEPPKLAPYGSFSSEGGLGVAVDQSSGDVWTAGFFKFSNGEFAGPGRIEKFDASGKVLPPPPFGEGFHSGAALNPANGDLYVLNAFGTIETYAPGTGELLSSFEVQPSRNFAGAFTVVQIAADSAGNVYLPVVPENEVLEYSPTGTLLHTFTGSGAGALKQPTGVAVDSSGDVWVADTANNRIEELSATGAFIAEIKSEGVQSVALDPRGDVYATVENSADLCGDRPSPCAHLMEYSSAGTELADVGAGTFGRPGAAVSPTMAAVNGSSGRVYVADTANSLVWIFGPPTPPVIDKEFTAEVSSSEAKLGALVNPGAIATSYRFEYDTREYTEGEARHGLTTPFPEGSVGEGVTSQAVWAAASGLAPGTTYHYRVVATNELGSVAGPDQTFTTETAARAECPNEQLRSGFSARLPDCRAYELVTPSTKTSVQVRGTGFVTPDGNGIGFETHEPLPGTPTGGTAYVATRGAGGWTSEDVIPLESYTGLVCNNKSNAVPAFSVDLSKSLISFGHLTRASEPGGSELETEECNAEGLQVVSGEPVGYQNLLLRDNKTGAYQLVNALEPGLTSVPADAHFWGASSDLSHVVFGEKAPLTSSAPAGVEDLYEWDEGAVRLVTVLPNGAPVTGSLAQALAGSYVVSSDGSHVLFTSGGGLYVRIGGERTVQVDESQGPGSSGGGSFQAATADGSRVFFTGESRLTADSTAAAGAPDLYECALPAGATKCELRDLTVATASEHANVIHVSVLGNADSSYVYFLATGVLATNTREYQNAEGSTVVEGAESGQHNLYVWHGGVMTFIAALNSGGYADSGAGQTSPDGTWLVFDSHKSLTGYDNTLSNGTPVEEIFLYSASSQQLVCASCNPSGEAPLGGDGASIAPSLQRRYLSDAGRLFFDTRDALVPSDTNAQVDVYEYENGQVHLISSGTSSSKSTFSGASESGGDVFFLSRQQLVPQNTGAEAGVIYDARVDGGLPAVSSPSSCTSADACRAPVLPQPSLFGAPASATFSGAGNLVSPPIVNKAVRAKKCKKAYVKKKSRCVKAKKRKKAGEANRKGRH